MERGWERSGQDVRRCGNNTPMEGDRMVNGFSDCSGCVGGSAFLLSLLTF